MKKQAEATGKSSTFLKILTVGMIALIGLIFFFKANTSDPAPENSVSAATTGQNLAPSSVPKLSNITISSTPVMLSDQNNIQSYDQIDELTYLKGWHLKSDDEKFGGFSALDITRNRLVAITDRGDWLLADFNIDKPEPLSNAVMVPFSGKTGSRKVDFDAEGLLRADFGYYVSFEQNHRVDYVRAPGMPAVPPDCPPDFPINADLSRLSPNGGIEALTWISPGRILLFAEQGRDWQGYLPVFDQTPDAGFKRGYAAPVGYSPTASTQLPDGSLLVVNRKYSPIDGVSVKLVHIDLSVALGKGPLKGRTIATLEAPFPADNFEAVNVMDTEMGTENGKPIILLMSDDNFSSRQRTLLLAFRFDGYQNKAELSQNAGKIPH